MTLLRIGVEDTVNMVWWFWRWVPEEQVEEECSDRMRVLDALPAIVRHAVHEAAVYTDPRQAKKLVRRYGARQAAEIILSRREDD